VDNPPQPSGARPTLGRDTVVDYLPIATSGLRTSFGHITAIHSGY
jgi:hypothetical protein